jgi:anti-sigma-K factor RskA
MSGEPRPEPSRDADWRRMMMWTFIALLVTLVMTAVAVYLAVYFFDRR